MVCGILVHQPGMEQAPPAVEAWRLNHWTTRGVPTPESEAHKEKAVEGKWPSRLGRVCEAGPSLPQEQLCWQHRPLRLWGKKQEAEAPRSSPGPARRGFRLLFICFCPRTNSGIFPGYIFFSHSKWEQFFWVLCWGGNTLPSKVRWPTQ